MLPELYIGCIFLDQSGKFVVEAGGCQDDFQSFIDQHSDIQVHPIDRLPFLGQFSDEKIAEYCEVNENKYFETFRIQFTS